VKILLVSYFFPPMNVIGAVRVGKFAKYLLEAGHDVRVLTAHDDSFLPGLAVEIPEENICYTKPFRVNILPLTIMRAFTGISKSDLGTEPPRGAIAGLGKLYRTILNFPDGQIGWMPAALRAGSRIIEDWHPDLIYASAVPFTSLMISASLSKRHKIPYVAELRDLWVDSHYYDYPLWRRVLETWLERRSLEQAAAIVTVSEPLADTLRTKYGIQTAVALNGFDPDDFPNAPSCGNDSGKILRIVYTGIIYPGRRDPTPLFQALRDMGEERNAYRVEFYGRRLNDVRELAKAFGIDDVVEIKGQVTYNEVMKIQHDSDILLLLLWDTPEEHGVYTGKLFEYLGAGRPILSLGLNNGVAANLIQSRYAGCVSNAPDRIASQLRQWSLLKSTGRLAGVDKDVFSDLTRNNQYAGLEQFIKMNVPVASAPRIRVDIIVNHLDLGGTELHLCQILPQLDNRLFDITVWTLRGVGSLEINLKRSGVPVHSLPARMPRSIGRIVRFFHLILRYWNTPPDIVHCFLPEAYLVGGFAGFFARHRRVVMSRRSLNTYQSRYLFIARIERFLHRQSIALLGNSRAVTTQLHCETEKPNIGLIYNGINLERFNHMPERNAAQCELGIPNDAVVFVIIANLIKYKGYFDLLSACSLLNDRCGKPWKLLCVGRDDGIGTSLKKYAESLGIEGNITWSGSVPDINTYLAASDIGINCSHEEGFSNSVLECMAASLPVVVTNVGGNSEAVIDRETGLVVPPKNPVSLANALVELAANESYRQRMGEAGRNRIVDRFSREKCVESYADFYRHIVGNAAGSVADRFPTEPPAPS
jgi:glycosyltransferase involved in cell wall biosynthesis